jgi:uncharacterized membrane protein YcaP (DUF421 family)
MDIVIRATAIYALLWCVTRGMGKRELSQLSAFDLILLVIVGDLIQQGVTQDDRSVTGAALAIGTITFWVVLLSFVSFKSRRVEAVLGGLPVVVLRDGEPLAHHLAGERLTVDDLAQEARGQGIDDLRKVRVAILEPEGSFSFILYDRDVIEQAQRAQHKPAAE